MSASLLSEYEVLARYNRLANEKLYAACSVVPSDELSRPMLTPYGSILGTLNHALIVDGIWLDRFTGTEREWPPVDALLHGCFGDLRAARADEDERIEEFITNLSIAFLSSRFRYKDRAGIFRQDSADLLVTHFFSHQTHHRGQVSSMLSISGIEAPNLDLHRIIHP